jgi:hypothetical protein
MPRGYAPVSADARAIVRGAHQRARRRLDFRFLQQDVVSGLAQRNERVLAGHPRDRALEPSVDERAHDALRDPTAPARLVHDQHASRRFGLAEDVFDGQWDKPAHVHHARIDPIARETARHPQGHVRAVGECDDCQCAAVTVYSRRPNWSVIRRPLARWGIGRQPGIVTRPEQVTGVVERNRL